MDPIHRIIIDSIAPKSRVLDLGCGEGKLLRHLVEEKKVVPLGIEIDLDQIKECVANRIPVLQLDVDEGLKMFDDQLFDVAILYDTMQEVKNPLQVYLEMLRVAKECIVVIPNFAQFRNRWSLLWRGRMPKSNHFPYEWYNTPNIHLMSIWDMEKMLHTQHVELLNAHYMGESFIDHLFIRLGLHNYGATRALFHIRKK